jgi:replicative DNA helicase
MIEEAIERTKPDLVCLGPLYKSFVDPGTKTSEAVIVEVVKYLDYLRTTYGFALWMEHHAPLGGSGGRELRPFGSAVWSRWPEFGLTLEPDLTATEPYVYRVGNFRGDRDVRHRPTKIKRGKVLPFEVVEFLTS